MKLLNRNVLIAPQNFETGKLIQDPKNGLHPHASVCEPSEAVIKVDRSGGVHVRYSYTGNEPTTLEKMAQGMPAPRESTGESETYLGNGHTCWMFRHFRPSSWTWFAQQGAQHNPVTEDQSVLAT